MNLSTEEQIKLTEIVKNSGGDIQKAVVMAYEEGILIGALRAAQRIGANLVQQQGSTGGGGGGDDDEADSPLTASDRAALKSLGIDPDVKFRQKNSTFTITGYKASRWKYPVSAVNQNGRRFKWPVDAVKNLQRMSPVR
jgi:hypothetical protein